MPTSIKGHGVWHIYCWNWPLWRLPGTKSIKVYFREIMYICLLVLKNDYLFKKIKNTAINIDYSLSLSHDSVTLMSTLMDLLTPLSPTLYNDKPMSLSTV